MQMPTIESRVAVLEAIMEQVNHRLSSIESRLTGIESRIEQGQRDARTDFRWLIGIMISTQLTTLITLGTLILVKLG